MCLANNFARPAQTALVFDQFLERRSLDQLHNQITKSHFNPEIYDGNDVRVFNFTTAGASRRKRLVTVSFAPCSP